MVEKVVDNRLRSALKPVTVPLRNWLTRAYAAGPELADAVRVCRRLSQDGVSSDVSYWPGDEDSPRSVADTYRAAIRMVAQERLDCAISIKAMVLAFDRQLVAELVSAGREAGVELYFDSRALELADRTFDLVVESARQHSRIGCALPGRWNRSLLDADRAVELGIGVRVVKGQWTDPDHPDIDPREGFLAVVDRLAGRARHVMVATHDASLARAALRRLVDAGTSCELELLFGLPMRAATNVARDLGVRCRVYVPYGHSWVPYALSWVKQNPRVLWWVLTDATFGRWSQFVK
jgi:proline dehydrogenase